MGRRTRVGPWWIMAWSAAVWALAALPARSAETNELLDEVIAGNEANWSLIQKGTAEYSVSMAFFQPKKHDRSEKITLYFDGLRTRSDSGNDRVIMGDDQVMEFRAPYPDPGVIIRTKPSAPRVADPRMQGLGKIGPIGGELRLWKNVPNTQVEAVKDGDLIKITCRSDPTHMRKEFWAAPDQGYCIVRYRVWFLKTPDRPCEEIDSKFKRVENGAFILTDSKIVKRVTGNEGDRVILHDYSETEISLTKINVKDKPDPKLFTLEGLGLPKRCRIQDRIRGREYLFGVPVVTEADIGKPSLGGPAGRRHPVLAVLSGVCLVGLLAWYFARRRQAQTA